MTDTQYLSSGTIAKVDSEQRIVFGWAAVSTMKNLPIVDLQGDQYKDSEVLAKAAYEFNLERNGAGEMHVRKGVGEVVESFALTKEKASLMGIETDREGWWIGFKVHDDKVWQGVKDGLYKGFSIGGHGVKRPAA